MPSLGLGTVLLGIALSSAEAPAPAGTPVAKASLTDVAPQRPSLIGISLGGGSSSGPLVNVSVGGSGSSSGAPLISVSVGSPSTPSTPTPPPTVGSPADTEALGRSSYRARG